MITSSNDGINDTMLTVRIPTYILDALDKEAQLAGTFRSHIVRNILEVWNGE